MLCASVPVVFLRLYWVILLPCMCRRVCAVLTLVRFCYGMNLVSVRMCGGFPVEKTPLYRYTCLDIVSCLQNQLNHIYNRRWDLKNNPKHTLTFTETNSFHKGGNTHGHLNKSRSFRTFRHKLPEVMMARN